MISISLVFVGFFFFFFFFFFVVVFCGSIASSCYFSPTDHISPSKREDNS